MKAWKRNKRGAEANYVTKLNIIMDQVLEGAGLSAEP